MKLLSTKETEAVQFLALGLLNKQIAHEMGISEATVKAHVGRALKKLGMNGFCRVRLALWHLNQLEPSERDAFIKAGLGT